MTEIIPAIMPKTMRELGSSVSLVRGAATFVQIDVMDGKFVPETSWPFPNFDQTTAPFMQEVEGLPYWEEMGYEFDLMIKNPENYVEKFVCLGAERIIIHMESASPERIKEAVAKTQALRTETGLAIGVETSNEELEQFINTDTTIDFVQFMGIARVGYQGEPFDERVIPKIKAFHEKHPDIIISVDGGVNFNSASLLV